MLIVLMCVAALLTASAWWYRRMTLARERRRRAALLAATCVLRPAWEHWSRAAGCGQIVIVAVGSYAARRLAAILKTFVATGTADHVGPILLVELDRDVRQQCLALIPAVFRPRVVEVDSSLLPAGMLGDTIGDALAVRHLWENEVSAGARHWFGRIDREARPALLLALLSPGGHAGLGIPILHGFNRRFPRAPIYVTTLLDSKPVVRRRFPMVRAYLNRSGLVRGMILLDNTRESSRNDLGIAVLFGGMAAASWVASRPTELWNALAYLFPRECAGSLATISVVAETLPVYHLPAFRGLPAMAYTRTDIVEEKIGRAVQTLIMQPELQSVPLESDQSGRARIIYVLAPICPDPDLQTLAARVERALEPWRAEHAADLLIYIASTGIALTPDTTEAPLVAVLLQPLTDDGTAIDALAAGATVDQRYIAIDPSRQPLHLTLASAPSRAPTETTEVD